MADWFSARILLAGFILLLATLLIVLVVGNLRRDSSDIVLDVVRQNADLALRKINYTETQDGRRKWSIQADSATHNLKGRVASIENIQMVIYEQDGGDVHVSSHRGRFDLENGLVTLLGDVKLENANGQSILTEELDFDNKNNILQSEKSVKVVSNEMQLTGVGFRYDLDQGIFKLRSSVEASFSGGALSLP